MDEPETKKELEMNLVREVEEEKAAVDLATNKVEPEHEHDESRDVVLGELPEDLQRLFVVGVTADKRLAQLHKDLRARVGEIKERQGALNERQAHDITTQHDIGHWRANAIAEMFDGEVRKLFPQFADGSAFGIRKGWKVVVPKEQPKTEDAPENDLTRLFRRLFESLDRVGVMIDSNHGTLEVVETIPGGRRMFVGRPSVQIVDYRTEQIPGEEFFDELVAGLVGRQQVASMCDTCPDSGRCRNEPVIRAVGM